MKSMKLFAAVLLALVAVAVLGFGISMFLNNHDITVSTTSTEYTKNASLDGITFWISKQWTVPTPATSDHLDALNYDAAKLDAELKADGHDTLYQDGHADQITPRQLTIYPYSLDKLYEVQVYVTDSYSTKQLSKDEVLSSNDPSSVEDLQLYHVNGKLVADYIQKGSGGAVDQRVILMRNSTGAKEVRVTVNRDQSAKITKDNFDGLMQLVGSMTFE